MIFRVLGAAALLLGALFGVIALLVLLPFLSNFSTSLLILAAVFGVFAYVFLAIGWQLVHPPARRRGRLEEAADEERWAWVSAVADEQVVDADSVGDLPGVEGGTPVADPQALSLVSAHASDDVVEEPLSGSAGVLAADSEPIVDAPNSTFSGFASVPRGGEPRLGEVDEPGAGKAVGNGNGRSSKRAEFKKAGPAVPERSESRR